MGAVVEPWEALADTLLQHEAVLARLGRGLPPTDFAGLFVSDEDAVRLLAELPGLGGAAEVEIDAARGALAPALHEARCRFARSLDGGSRFASLVRRARLDADEAEVLALVLAVDLDDRRRRLVGYVQDDLTLSRITLGTLRALFPRAVRTMRSSSRLARAALVTVEDEGTWARRMVAPAAALAWWVLDADGTEDETAAGLDAGIDVVEGAGAGSARLVAVSGGDGDARLHAALAVIAPGVFLRCRPPTDARGWEALALAATLHADGVVLDVGGTLDGEGRRWMERADHLVWVVSSEAELPLEDMPRRDWVEAHADRAPATTTTWAEHVGGGPVPGHLLTEDQVALVGRAHRALGERDPRDAVRRLAGGRLDGLARRIRPSRQWADVVLPPDQSARLHELVSRFRHRDLVHAQWGFRAAPSTGLVALFSGPSGTGKTLAAEIVAGQLGLDLYQVDLSSLVSKYIGETEKNLDRVFEAAGHASLALFFDEADALFGRRSAVNDAHDRYANVEVAYLLQRLERYDGLVVLATNLQRNIDPAFLRRVHVAVDFPTPEAPQRQAIWALSFPATAPVDDDVDLGFLAERFQLSGGAIHNVALHAAFLAAEAGTAITMATIVAALRRELQKLGRLCPPEDFGPYLDLAG